MIWFAGRGWNIADAVIGRTKTDPTLQGIVFIAKVARKCSRPGTAGSHILARVTR